MIRDEITALFAEISDESVDLVVSGGVTDVPPGQVLAQAGDPGVGMLVDLDGSVAVERGVPRQTFELLLETEPTFTRALLRELAARLVQARTGH